MELDRGPRYLLAGMSILWFIVVLLETRRAGHRLAAGDAADSLVRLSSRIRTYAFIVLALSFVLLLERGSQPWGFAIAASTLGVAAAFAAIRQGLAGSRGSSHAGEGRAERVA